MISERNEHGRADDDRPDGALHAALARRLGPEARDLRGSRELLRLLHAQDGLKLVATCADVLRRRNHRLTLRVLWARAAALVAHDAFHSLGSAGPDAPGVDDWVRARVERALSELDSADPSRSGPPGPRPASARIRRQDV